MSEDPGTRSETALFELAYNELRRLASAYLHKERSEHTLQTSALVNEAYLRLSVDRKTPFQDRQHYLRVASQAMRRVLVDHARRRGALKREAGERIDLDQAAPVLSSNLEELLIVDTALDKLSAIDPRQAQIVELRFFGGLSVTETAEALEISEKTVKRDWSVARAWLRGELDRSPAPGAAPS
ncbi:Sigma factor, ECF-like family protein [Candidatus Sulfopaludibacter sp. SbA4]|nr:Sigma factor, ECF-like family protein [Candidatus Sulfopaludibacter sp. SbA4]